MKPARPTSLVLSLLLLQLFPLLLLADDPICGKWRFFNGSERLMNADGSSNGVGMAPDTRWQWINANGGERSYAITDNAGRVIDRLTLRNGGTQLWGMNGRGAFLNASRMDMMEQPSFFPPNGGAMVPAAPAPPPPRKLRVRRPSGNTDAVIGTWQRPDKSQIEFKPDGIISRNSEAIGSWKRLTGSGMGNAPIMRITGTLGYFKLSLSHYKRQLYTEDPGNGQRTTLERLDNGPTKNPDVPDARTALQMEDEDLEDKIADLELRLPNVRAEAAAKWNDHWAARAIGRISTHNLKAQELDRQAEGMERGIRDMQARQLEVQSRLADK